MKLHFSIDDVIYSLMDLYNEAPKSVFCVPFFGFLKQMHEKYGAVFTLYAFENYAESFFINSVPKHYWEELVKCDFIRIGFHGVFFFDSVEIFEKKCVNFYSCIPICLRPSILRLHEYKADATMLEIVRRFGVSQMLCSERERKKTSYFFSESEEKNIGTVPWVLNNMSYVKTSMRIEFYEYYQLIEQYKQLILFGMEDSMIAVYTHEKYYYEYKKSIEAICEMTFKSNNIQFVF